MIYLLYPLVMAALGAGLKLCHHVYTTKRLRHPMLKGVYLPQVDDPRWYWNEGHCKKGVAVRHARMDNHAVDCDGILLNFNGNWKPIGRWPAYNRAVEAHLAERERRELADASLKLLE